MGQRISHELVAKQLLRELTLRGHSKAQDLADRVGVSRPVVSRVLASLGDAILVVGRARNTLYAARREVAGVGYSLNIYEAPSSGSQPSQRLGVLHAVQPRGFYFETDIEAWRKFYDDLPFFLHDLRPSGFLGRLIPSLHKDLQAPQNIQFWTGEDCLRYFVKWGVDLPGNLLVGDATLSHFVAAVHQPQAALSSPERPKRYEEIATHLIDHLRGGSSAAGEQPKFLAEVATPHRHVLVKFSPPRRDPIGQRWSDLLICEHVAHKTLRAAGVATPHSEVLQNAERTFLEVVRFDRVDRFYRRGVMSLLALDLEYVGSLRNWSQSAAALHKLSIVSAKDNETIDWLMLFGAMIGNTDMHHGNLSFLMQHGCITSLAPIYDMLPMLYAPVQGHMGAVEFSPPMPRAADFRHWQSACDAAIAFWDGVSAHPMVSHEFKTIATNNAKALRATAPLGELLPR